MKICAILIKHCNPRRWKNYDCNPELQLDALHKKIKVFLGKIFHIWVIKNTVYPLKLYTSQMRLILKVDKSQLPSTYRTVHTNILLSYEFYFFFGLILASFYNHFVIIVYVNLLEERSKRKTKPKQQILKNIPIQIFILYWEYLVLFCRKPFF